MSDNVRVQDSKKRVVPLGRTELVMGVQQPGAVRSHDDEDGVVEVDFRLERSSLDDRGQPDPAVTAVVMDHVLAAAIRVNPRQLGPLATTQLHFDVLQPFPAVGTTLRARAYAPTVSERGSFATALLLDDQGKEIARSSGWFIEVPGGNPDGLADFLARAEQDIDYGENYSSLASALRFAKVSGSEAAFDEAPELLNENGTLHGGALTVMGLISVSAVMADRQDYVLQSVQVNFLKGAVGPIHCRVWPRHMGRRFRSFEIEVVMQTGAIAATISCGFRIR